MIFNLTVNYKWLNNYVNGGCGGEGGSPTPPLHCIRNVRLATPDLLPASWSSFARNDSVFVMMRSVNCIIRNKDIQDRQVPGHNLLARVTVGGIGTFIYCNMAALCCVMWVVRWQIDTSRSHTTQHIQLFVVGISSSPISPLHQWAVVQW